MSRNRKNNGNKDSGSSWTSYSDLFTSLAVVFLVMFVFALIKAAVNNVKMAKTKKETKEYLEGKVPKKLKQEVAKKEQMIEKSIKEIDQYDNIIDQKIQDLNQLVKNLSKQKKIMKDLLADKKEKEVILSDINKVVTAKNYQIEEMEQVIKQYEVQKNKVTNERNNLNQKMVSLQKRLEQMLNDQKTQSESIKFLETNNNKQQQSLNQYRSTASVLEKNLVQMKENYTVTSNELTEKNQQIEVLTKSNQNFQQELNEMSKDLKSHQNQLQSAQKSLAESKNEYKEQSNLVSQLESKVSELKSEFGKLKGEYARAKSQYESQNSKLGSQVESLEGKLAGLGGKHTELKGKYGDLKGKFNQLKGEYANAKGLYESQNNALGDELKGLKGKLAGLGDQNAGLKGKIGNLKDALGGLEGKYNNALSLNKQCLQEKKYVQNKYNNLAKKEKAVRKIASVQESIRENIAENLAKRFREANLPVVVDKRTGNIVFQMDDLFLFKNNSAELTEGIKEKLNKIVPIYADELLGKPEVAQHILRINIEGHASPTFKKSFVDPLDADPEAYGYNLELSTKRATQLVQYMFGPEIEPFPYQNKMRVMTNAVGYSFSQAIKKQNITATCGQYDCPKSRRVVISFTLNNNQMIIDAFEKQKKLSANIQ
jgi:chromosome segregation ATPase